MLRDRILLAVAGSLVAVPVAAIATAALASPSLTILDPDEVPFSSAQRLSPAGTLITGVRSVGDNYHWFGVRWTRDGGWSESAGAGRTDVYDNDVVYFHCDLAASNELLFFQWDENGVALRLAPDAAEPSVALPMPDECTPVDHCSSNAISADGDTVLAHTEECGVVRWTESGGTAVVAPSVTGALGLSDDGKVIASSDTGGLFHWTEAGGVQSLDVPGRLDVLSGDGSTIGGVASSDAFVWDAIHGVTVLGDLPGDGGQTIVDISADGSVVMGRDGSGATERAFAWKRDGGIVSLGDRTRAVALSADGRYAVGTLLDEEGEGDSVLLWDLETGMQRLLESILRGASVAVPAGGLRRPFGISDDGSTIAGSAVGGWVATIPEPATTLLHALAIAALAALRAAHAAQT